MTQAALHPLPLAELVDYWLAELDPQREQAIEEHLFACAACAERLDAVRACADAIVGLVRTGGLASSATTALINRFARDRLNIRQYTIAPNEVVACTVAPTDDFLMARFLLAEPRQGRIDIAVLDEGDREVSRVEDVAQDARTGEVITFQSARPTQNEPSGRRQYVLIAPGERGERILGRYTLDHTAMREA